MSIAVEISSGLREYCRASSEIRVSAKTVREALVELKLRHTSLYESICDETGAVRQHVNLFVNSELVLVRQTQGMNSPLNPGDVLTIWQAVSGG